MQNEFIQKNQLLKHDNRSVRILDTQPNRIFVIDCIKRTMPVWVEIDSLKEYILCSEEILQEMTNIFPVDMLDAESKKIMYERFTMISPLLLFISDTHKRKECYGKLNL